MKKLNKTHTHAHTQIKAKQSKAKQGKAKQSKAKYNKTKLSKATLRKARQREAELSTKLSNAKQELYLEGFRKISIICT